MPWDEELRQLAEFAASVTPAWWHRDEPLASIGLMLHPTHPYPPYPDTPALATPLLSCGVDGVHWSGLSAENAFGYIVVMTVPPSVGVNLVVGESIREFLSLGCHSHFSVLAGLVEDITESLEPTDEEVADAMAALRSRFGLSPWPDVPARLTELEAQYGRPEGRVPRDREAEAELVRRSREFVES